VLRGRELREVRSDDDGDFVGEARHGERE
jgi:hypothetical protein